MDGRAWGDELAERAFKEAVAGMDDYPIGTVATITVKDGAATEFPIVERVSGGWQSGAHYYGDDVVSAVAVRLGVIRCCDERDQAQNGPKTARGSDAGATNTPPTGPSDPPAPQNASESLPADVVTALLEAYKPEGIAIWLRSWLAHPDSRTAMEAGVGAAWSGQPPDAPPSDRLRARLEVLAGDWEAAARPVAHGQGQTILGRVYQAHADDLRALLDEEDAK